MTTWTKPTTATTETTATTTITTTLSSLILFWGSTVFVVKWKQRALHLPRQQQSQRRGDDDDNSNLYDRDDDRQLSVLSFLSSSSCPTDLPSHLRRQLHKAQRHQESIPRLSRKTALYDNYRMYASNVGGGGDVDDNDATITVSLLCTTSAKKARWYVRKGLAVWIQDIDDDDDDKDNGRTMGRAIESNTPTKSIRLLFQPKNENRRQMIEKRELALKEKNNECDDNGDYGESVRDAYQKTPKHNLCVACGTDRGLMKHYVVPHAYRKLLPKRFKSHLSHDVVLLCVDCHVCADRDGRTRHERQLEQKYRINNNNNNNNNSLWHVQHETHKAVLSDPVLKRVQKCARALLWHRQQMPHAKRQDCIEVVQNYIFSSVDEKEEPSDGLTTETLERLAHLETDRPNPHYISTPELVVRQRLVVKKKGETCTDPNDVNLKCETMDDAAIEDFVREWRNLFVETLQPRFLPKGWSVDSPVTNDE